MGLFNRNKAETVAETPSVAIADIAGEYTLDPSPVSYTHLTLPTTERV